MDSSYRAERLAWAEPGDRPPVLPALALARGAAGAVAAVDSAKTFSLRRPPVHRLRHVHRARRGAGADLGSATMWSGLVAGLLVGAAAPDDPRRRPCRGRVVGFPRPAKNLLPAV